MDIKFRPHQRKDIPQRVKWLNNQKVNRYLGDYIKKTNTKNETKWFNNYLKNKNKLFFTIIANGSPIGIVGFIKIDKTNKKGEIFIMIGEDDYRGKGLGGIAVKFIINHGFKEKKLHKISLGVWKNNKQAIKCYERVGFKVEGVLKDEAIVKNKYQDLILMAIFNK